MEPFCSAKKFHPPFTSPGTNSFRTPSFLFHDRSISLRMRQLLSFRNSSPTLLLPPPCCCTSSFLDNFTPPRTQRRTFRRPTRSSFRLAPSLPNWMSSFLSRVSPTVVMIRLSVRETDPFRILHGNLFMTLSLIVPLFPYHRARRKFLSLQSKRWGLFALLVGFILVEHESALSVALLAVLGLLPFLISKLSVIFPCFLWETFSHSP